MNGKVHMFLATIADGKTAASRGEGQKNCKNSTSVRFWVGPDLVGPCALMDLSWQESDGTKNSDGPTIHNANRGDSRESTRENRFARKEDFHNVRAICANRLISTIPNF